MVTPQIKILLCVSDHMIICLYIRAFYNTSLAAPGALAHRLQRRTACNAAPPASGPQNGRRGLERGPILGYLALPSTFAK